MERQDRIDGHVRETRSAQDAHRLRRRDCRDVDYGQQLSRGGLYPTYGGEVRDK